MIDRKLLRDPMSLQKVVKSEENRFKDTQNVYDCANLDRKIIELMFESENIQKEINIRNKEMKNLFKSLKSNENPPIENLSLDKNDSQEDIKILQEEIANLKQQKAVVDEQIMEKNAEFDKKFKNIGCILDPRVPISKNEDDATIYTKFTSKRKVTPILQFPDIMEKMECVDMKRGSKVAGHRGYFLIEELGLLENALVRYSIDFLRKKDYKLIQAPVLVNKEIMERTCQLNDFDEQLYSAGEFYLCATSEQPISGLYMNERLTDQDLPKKFAGQSLCFRKEAGAAGKDNRGIFRVHQFEKIEQFIICKPDDSEKHHTEMIETSIEFYKSLDISFNVIRIVSGDMNDSAALKYDLEASFPFTKNFRELVSASNCSDYQS
ncbi:serine-tRNA synthetase, partial [Pseudoloma neurophilia]